MSQKVVILGSTSHIAKGLTNNFLQDDSYVLHLRTRSSKKLMDLLPSLGLSSDHNCVVEEGYQDFMSGNYDVIFNCVGIGPPNMLHGNYNDWFTVTEEYDNLAIEYLRRHPKTLYINFSSGAVYGGDGTAPAEEGSPNNIRVNQLAPKDYYVIANLNAEAKHRSLDTLRIVDLRIFSYFSRFIDLESGYFITDVLACALNGTMLETDEINIVRDYVHPDDLFSLVTKCMETGDSNSAFDVISAKPVEKREVLEYFSVKYGLKYEIKDNLDLADPNGSTNIYCSNYNKAACIGYKPAFSSMDTIGQESKYILSISS